MGQIREYWRDGELIREDTRTLDEAKAAARARIAAARFAAETAGVTFKSKLILTDDRTTAKVDQLLRAMAMNPLLVVDWKTADGSFITINAGEAADLFVAMVQHVQGAFVREKARVALIEAAATNEAADAVDW